MTQLIPYFGQYVLVHKQQNTHEAFQTLADFISKPRPIHQYPFLAPLALPNTSSWALVEQSTGTRFEAQETYRDIKKVHHDIPIVSVASARSFMTQDDVATFGIEGVILWEPRVGKLREKEVVINTFAFYPAPRKIIVADYVSLPPRPIEPVEPQRMKSRTG